MHNMRRDRGEVQSRSQRLGVAPYGDRAINSRPKTGSIGALLGILEHHFPEFRQAMPSLEMELVSI